MLEQINMYVKYIVGVFIMIYLNASGQNRFAHHYSKKDNLPSSQVYDVIQDKNGYLWFGTDRGLVKYNGYTFEAFDTQDGLTDNTIFHFYKDLNGVIWAITFNNTLFYIEGDRTFNPFKYNDVLKNEAQHNTIKEIFFDDDGSLYVSYGGEAGYIRIDVNGKVHKTMSDTFSYYISQNINNQIFNYKLHVKDKIIEHGSYMYAPANKDVWKFEALVFNEVGVFSFENTLYMLKDSTKSILNTGKECIGMGIMDSTQFWVGYRYGGVQIYSFTGRLEYEFLLDKSVTGLCEDEQGGIWVTTLNSGVYLFDEKSFKITEVLPGYKSHSLTSDTSGNLYIGNYEGSLYKRDYRTGSMKCLYKTAEDYPVEVQYFSSINDVVFSNRFQTQSVSGNYIPSDGFNVFSLSDDQDGKIIAQGMISFSFFDKEPKLYFTTFRINDISEFGDVFLIGSLDGLRAVNLDTLGYENCLNMDSLLIPSRVDDIDVKGNTCYIASLGQGVVVLKTDTMFSISRKGGLYSNMATEVFIENDSTVWVCGNSGLNRIVFSDEMSYTISGISELDGLLSDEVFDVEVIEDMVYVATAKGVCAFNKTILDDGHTTHIDYHLSLKQTKVNYNPASFQELTVLEYDENRLEINYEAVSLKYNDKLLYRYKLEGVEDQWNYTDVKRVIYPALRPGTYKFILQVKSEFDHNEWESNACVLDICIAPPFYKTWWFLIGTSFFLSLLIRLVFKYNILHYNKDMVKHLSDQVLDKLLDSEKYILIKENGIEIKIKTSDVLYVKSDRNYIELVTLKKTYIVRQKIGEFLNHVPEPLEFLRIHRSYIIRIDKVNQKTTTSVIIHDVKIPIGNSYRSEFEERVMFNQSDIA